MFTPLPERIQSRMRTLEEIDRRDRDDGTPRLERMRQIPPETGRFLSIVAAGVPPGEIIEIGTSAGYSTLWLSLACRALGRQLTSFEVLPAKVSLAKESFRVAGVEDIVTLVHADARERVADLAEIAFCFLDAEKEIYGEFYDLVIPRLVSGGVLIADNATNYSDSLAPMIESALTDTRVDAMVATVGKGLLLCRRK